MLVIPKFWLFSCLEMTKKNVHFPFLHSSSLNFNGENESFYETSPWPSKMR